MHPTAFLLALTAFLLWGCSPLFDKLGMRGLTPLAGLTVRVLAAAVMVGVYSIDHRRGQGAHQAVVALQQDTARGVGVVHLHLHPQQAARPLRSQPRAVGDRSGSWDCWKHDDAAQRIWPSRPRVVGAGRRSAAAGGWFV